VIPAVLPVSNPPPELRVKVPVLPSSTFVPILNTLPLFTVKLIAPEMVPLDLEYVCVPDLLKLKLPVPVPPFVSVPPDIEKSPAKLIVPVLALGL